MAATKEESADLELLISTFKATQSIPEQFQQASLAKVIAPGTPSKLAGAAPGTPGRPAAPAPGTPAAPGTPSGAGAGVPAPGTPLKFAFSADREQEAQMMTWDELWERHQSGDEVTDSYAEQYLTTKWFEWG